MPNPWEVESLGQYGKNQERFPATKQFSYRDLQAWNALKSLPPGSPVPSDPYSLVPPKPKGALENLLELPSRPLAGISSGLGYALQGRNPLEGAWEGLQGQSQIKDITGVLEQQGVPELGRLEVGPFKVSGRDVLGFGLSTLADPLSYTGTAIGRLGGLGVSAAERAIPRVAEGAVPELPKFADALAAAGRDTLKGQIAQKGASIPGVGTLMGLVSPEKVADKPALQAAIAWGRQMEDKERLKTILQSRFADSPFQLGADGMSLELIPGYQYKWGDVFGNTQKYSNLITDAQKDYANEMSRTMQALTSYYELATGKAVDKIESVEPGWQYVARVVNKGDTILPTYVKQQVGGLKSTLERKRVYSTMAEGVEHGEVYAGPMETLLRHADNVYSGVAQAQLRDALTNGWVDEAGRVIAPAGKTYGAKATSEIVGEMGWQASKQEIADYAASKGISESEAAVALRTAATKQASEYRKSLRGAGVEISSPAGAAAMARREGYAPTGLSLTKGVYLPKETVEALTKRLLDNPVNPIFQRIGDVGQISRIGMTGFDGSAAMIQGLPGLFSHPQEWGKAFGQSLRMALDPTYMAAYLAQPKAQYWAARIPGLIISQSEPFEAVSKGGPLVGMAGGLFNKAAEPFQRLFEGFGNVYRIETADSLGPAFERQNALPALGDFLNKSSGIVSSKAMGVLSDQRALESGMLFFAPRYLRATLSLLSDAFTETGPKGWESRRAIGSMLFGGLAMYNKLALAAGQEPNLDPSSGKFLTLKVGEDNVGIGSIWVSLARLLGNMVANPGDMAKWDMDENPLMKWMRSRLPPVSSTAVDLIDREDYLGEPLDTPLSLAKYMSSKFLPFALEARLIQNPPSEWVTLPAEEAGAKVYPQSVRDRRDTEAQKRYSLPFDSLDAFQKQTIHEIVGVSDRTELEKATTQVFKDHYAKLEGLAKMVGVSIGKSSYRKQRGEAKEELSYALQQLDETRYEGMSAEQRAQAEADYIKKLSPRDAARKVYFKILSEKDPYSGAPSWEAAESFLNSQPQEIQQYIDQMGEAGLRNLPPVAQALETEYRAVRKSLKPYWDLFDDVMSARGLKQTWDKLTPLEKADFVDTPVYKAVQRELGQRKELWRLQHPKEDEMLVEWGYAGKTMRQQLAERGGGLGAVPGGLSSQLSSPLSKGL